MSELAFFRVLKLGSFGKDVRAVKRALARAGHGTLPGSYNPVLGPLTASHLKAYQRTIPVMPTGNYGPQTHARLIQWFDAYARKLYEEASHEPAIPIDVDEQAPAGSLHLPSTFTPTHETAGLPGFPAVDVFAQPGTAVLAPEDGRVSRLSGRDPRDGGSPGGAYGWSIYLDTPTGRYFMTHFGSREVADGQQVAKGQPIGTVCDSAVSGKPGTSHIHHAKTSR